MPCKGLKQVLGVAAFLLLPLLTPPLAPACAQLPAHVLAPSPQVLIESRQGPVRNILNAQQLVDDCNRLSASWQLDPASPIQRIQCRWVGTVAEVGWSRWVDCRSACLP